MRSFQWSAFVVLSLVPFANAPAFAGLACANRLGGTWDFGTVPYACNVSPGQSASSVLAQYRPVVYDDASAGRRAYVSAVYPSLREMGTYYLRRRNPGVSDAELQGFLQALYSLGAQESMFTHYRRGADGITRFMRGDSLHGYGMMQVDDRSHAAAINQGKGVDLAENMVYGLDLFYAMWVRAATVSCVSSATNWRSRARAAWAAYNGGQGSICRWTNSGSSWARNDQGFASHYDGRAWLKYVADPKAAAPIDVRCLAEGTRPCALPKATQ